MTEPEELEEDLFADLYEGDDDENTKPIVEPSTQPDVTIDPAPNIPTTDGPGEPSHLIVPAVHSDPMNSSTRNEEIQMDFASHNVTDIPSHQNMEIHTEEEARPIGIKEDGKMFIGGLNWETTDQSLKEYFSKFGEVQECTVMRDGASGRSRGFGFLTFKDPRTVNVVMVKEHYLDGKIIDPKRAIPRDEQERTSKIFVGGVSQEATEQIFKDYFAQYGRVVDATLMMDKDTGRPRGFGFVTFDSEAAVENTLNGDLTILGKPIEVKKAQPRGNIREEEESLGRGGRGRGRPRDFNDQPQNGNQNGMNQNQQFGGMTPQMMAQYWAKMQQYFATMQQQMAAAAMQNGGMGNMGNMGNMANMNGMGGMNPAMMQQMQMQQMQQMKAMQMAQQQQQQQGRGSASPMPDMQNQGGGMAAMQGMNPAMMQQIQAMQAQMGGAAMGMGNAMGNGMGMNMGMGMAMGGNGGGSGGGGGGGNGSAAGSNGGAGSGRRGTPGYNAQEQLAFEQQKYEQQQARRVVQDSPNMQQYGGTGPTNWEGMYDDVPQPNPGAAAGRGSGGGRGGGSAGKSSTPNPANAPPANAPTGPKNAGKPGANYRGGHSGRGAHRGNFHPYHRHS